MISINNKQLDGLCYDFEYQVTDKKVCRNTRCTFFFSLTIKIDSFF